MKWISDIARLLAFLTRWSRGLRGARWMTPLIVVAGAISGLANAAFLVIINSALRDPLHPSRRLVWSFVGLCLLLPVSRFLSGALLIQLSGRAAYELRTQLARKILAAPLRKLEELGPHRLVGTLTEDIIVITSAVASYPNLLMQLFIVVGCLGYLGWLSLPALVGVLVVMVVGIVVYQLPVTMANRLLAASRESWDQVAKGIRALTEGTKELKLHRGRRQHFFTGSFEPAAGVMRDKGVRGRTILHAASCWGHILFFVVIGLMLFVLPAYRPTDRSVLTGFILLLLYLMTPLESILSAIPALSAAVVSVQKIQRLGLSLEPEPAGAAQPAALPPVARDWGALEASGVVHSYRADNADETFRLGPIDLVLPAGELLFLTGGNGSGKTTLGKLLCGLYTPESGEIRFNGAPVTPEGLEAYRQYFSAVFTDCFVLESLRGLNDGNAGNAGHAGDIDVDARANAHLAELRLDRVVSVKDGTLSRIAVSQGQKKRLALLAAFLEDRPIYFFDEWAADQDVVFKELFYRQVLPELKARGKTVIVISHDDRYYDAADRVIKLDSGRIASEMAPVALLS